MKAEYQPFVLISKHNSRRQKKRATMTQNDTPTDFTREKTLLVCPTPTKIMIRPQPEETPFPVVKHQSYGFFWRAKQSRFLLCVCGRLVLGSLPRSVCAESASVSICLNTAETQSDTPTQVWPDVRWPKLSRPLLLASTLPLYIGLFWFCCSL